jgi:hypothetical protein
MKEKEQFTVEEKCVLFDKLYSMARAQYDEVVVKGNPFGMKDCKQYIFEAVFEGCLGNVWPEYNDSLA